MDQKYGIYLNVKGIETVQTKFVKYVHHINKEIPDFMVHGGSGKLSVAYHIQCKMINFWFMAIDGIENKMVAKMYVFVVTFGLNTIRLVLTLNGS